MEIASLLAVISACSPDPGATRNRVAPAAPSGERGSSSTSPLVPATTPQLIAPPPLDIPDGVCASTGTIEASLRPPNLLFVIDRSGSMNCNLPPITSSEECEQLAQQVKPDEPSKWSVVRAALESAIAQLPPMASAGISYFSNDDACGVQSRPHVPMGALDSNQLASLSASLEAVVPRGGTPMVGSLILAFKQLNPDQTPDQPYGNRFVVLLTDGQEGCAPEAKERLLTVEMPKSHTAAITTFVIGVPGSEPSRGFLSRLAFAGGTASNAGCDHDSADPTTGDCHFDMTKDTDLASGLTRALSAISGRALSCELNVPTQDGGGAIDYDKVNIVYTEKPGDAEQLIVQDAQRVCDQGADGWQYSADKSRILICGGACEKVRRAASIRVALGCKTIVPD